MSTPTPPGTTKVRLLDGTRRVGLARLSDRSPEHYSVLLRTGQKLVLHCDEFEVVKLSAIPPGVSLDENGQFRTPNGPMGIVAKKVRGRWQYRDVDSKALYASGMEPAAFVKRFWFREDFTA